MEGRSLDSEALSLPVVVDSSARPDLDEDALSMFGATWTRRVPHRRVLMRASIVPGCRTLKLPLLCWMEMLYAAVSMVPSERREAEAFRRRTSRCKMGHVTVTSPETRG